MARRAPRGLPVAAACLAVLVAVPAFAFAAKHTSKRIVLGTSVGPVHLGETRHKVEAALGLDHVPPRTVKHGTGIFIAQYPKVHLSLFYSGHSNAKVVAVSSNNRHYTTAKGLHIGAQRAAVRRAYPRLKCGAAQKFCDRAGPAGRVTRFGFDEHGRVNVIAVGQSRFLADL